MKFRETAFIELNQQANQAFYTSAKRQTWKGFRVLCVDGSKYELPKNPAMHDEFGGQSNQFTKVPMALGSCLYDAFHGLVVDARLAPYCSNERELAYQHLQSSAEDDLILYDRGYPAFWLFAAHDHLHRDYCMRVKSNFNQATSAFVASGKQQEIVTLMPDKDMITACQEKDIPQGPVTVRLLRVNTSKGEYILLTSLLDKRRYPVKAFKELYHLRWQIEEGYKKQKSWLEIENFSGKSVLSVKQDFHARMLNLTLAAVVIYSAHPYIQSQVSRRQYAYKINFAQTLSSMKDTVLRLLFGDMDSLAVRRWLKSIGQSLSMIRPGRSFERKKTRSGARKFHFSYKRAF